MSLTSLLLPTKKAKAAVDAGLDVIFKSSAGPSTVAQASAASVPSTAPQKLLKRKNTNATDDANQTSNKRRVTSVSGAPTDASSSSKRNKEKGDKKKGKEPRREDGSDDEHAFDGDNDGVEEAHKLVQPVQAPDVDSESDSDPDAEPPQHETLQIAKAKRRAASKKVKYNPPGETREQREMRTIFVGNLPIAIVKDRKLVKQLKRHIFAHVPTAQIESVRFRSVAFQNPTTKLDEDGGDDDEASAKKLRSHKRATDWRENGKGKTSHPGEDEDMEDKKGEKQYMTPAQKRRLAAIKGDLHESAAATVNAYVVFAHPLPPSLIKGNIERRRGAMEAMDPFEAAREVVRTCDGSTFESRVLRIDFARKPPGTASGGADASGMGTDPKLSVFVGNLDFASTEDDLRAFFEKVMVEERGKPSAGPKEEKPVDDEASSNNESEADDEEISDEEKEEDSSEKPKLDNGSVRITTNKKPTWVTRVRIIRDRDTQLGKGFGYVQFVDRDCVDELLALEPEKLRFAKRKLRVQKCKTVPGASVSTPKGRPQANVPSNKFKAVAHPELPKGDPTLGTRIAALPKDQRKVAKAADPARSARRLAKKKARMTMEKGLQKDTVKGRERVRERKDKREKGTMNTGKKDAKKRVRSEKSLEKRNMKK